MYRSSSKLITNTMISKWIFLLLSFFPSIHGTDFLPPSSAELSTTWNVLSGEQNLFNDPLLTQILSKKISNSTETPAICLGFTFTNHAYPRYILGISARRNCSRDENPKLELWSGNRNTPVTENATLQFSSQGDLILREANGTIVWSTNTSGKSVVGMRIIETGSLLLYDENNTAVWSSFDEQPADTWLPGLKLVIGQRITANAGMFYLSVTDDGLCAFINSNPPQRYRKYFRSIQFQNGGLSFSDGKDGSPIYVEYISDSGNVFQYMRLDNDGHLRVYNHQWDQTEDSVVDDIFTTDYSNCSYPTVCGSYGICSDDGQCTCLGEDNWQYLGYSNFLPLDYRQPRLGCKEKTPLSCNSSLVKMILVLEAIYISFVEVTVNNTDLDNCYQACLNNCSCKAALFRSYDNSFVGDCSLPSQLFSFMNKSEYNLDYSVTTFLKVNWASTRTEINSKTKDVIFANRFLTIPGFLFGIIFFVVLVGVIVYVSRNEICSKEVAMENHLSNESEDRLDESSEMPRRFPYEELKSATRNFNKKIGLGGFGSVYEGMLGNETIAVKCLDLSQGQSHGRKQFLAEVKTIGSIHHVNLVKLVGFCAEKSHKLLAYEYMCNGSLDKWIFHKDLTLDWHTRRRVILDIARGLSYLHMECRKKIIHLDIKPQNILLDGNFNAKISDFGLARFIEKDESQVLTMMRGTRGYLAPEWLLNRRITEKVDVYSFGVVVLETMCGRRNLDYSQPEESEILLHVVKRKAEEDTLYDIVDKRNEDMQQHQEEAVKMIRTTIWCLQGDCTNRPSMSMVVKVLEGGMDMESISDYSFLTLAPMVVLKQITASASAPLTPLMLSGPR